MAFLRRSFKGNAASTTLAAGINNSVTSFSVAAGGGAGYPTGGSGDFFVVIDRGLSTEEKIRCSARATDAFTVAASGRGVDDTTAQTHSSGATVEHCITATDADEANNWVSQLSAATTAKGDEAIASAANTLTKLAVGADNTVRIADSAAGTNQKWAKIAEANITAATITDASIAAANKDGTAGTASMRTLGTGATQAASGTDSRFTDSRAPSGAAGGSLAGTYPNPTLGANTVGASQITDGTVTNAELAGGVLPTFQSFSFPGTLTAPTIGKLKFRCPVALTVQHVRAVVNTAPTGAAILVDVDKNGTTIFSTQGNRPTIAISATTETATTAPDVTSFAAGDLLSVDVDQVGSSVAGADLVVTVYLKVT